MLYADRWTLRRPDEPSNGFNPSAGFAVGRVPGARPKETTDVAKSISGAVGSWHPTVANLAVLIVLEVAAYAALRYVFRSAHGG